MRDQKLAFPQSTVKVMTSNVSRWQVQSVGMDDITNCRGLVRKIQPHQIGMKVPCRDYKTLVKWCKLAVSSFLELRSRTLSQNLCIILDYILQRVKKFTQWCLHDATEERFQQLFHKKLNPHNCLQTLY